MATLFVDNLTVIDFCYACAERGIVGASWIVDIELSGELDQQGMVFDFGDVKKVIKRHIDEQYDHKLWLHQGLPALKLKQHGNQLQASWCNNRQQGFKHSSPSDAVFILDSHSVELAPCQSLIATSVLAQLPSNVQEVVITLRQESIEGANYCYTHGLQAHLGNCQRIAHGHRSRLEISIDGQRNAALEQQWAQQWRDIYLASAHHIAAQDDNSTSLRYTAEQGEFSLTLPTEAVYVFDIVSTIENIADYIATQIAATISPAQRVTVKAFEGVAKGAKASYYGQL